MRGMIKWQPFSTMLTKKDITLIEKNRQKTRKPLLAEDKINEIDEIIKEAIKNNKRGVCQEKCVSSKILLH